MQIDDMSKGSYIELEVKCNGKTMSFRSEIAFIRNNSLLVNTIKVHDQTVGFSDNCIINLLYNSEGKLYLWENIVVRLVKYEGVVYHKLDLFGEGKPYNRRDSFRMYIGEDMSIYVNTAAGPTALTVLVKDISETGFAFITPEDIDVERTVRLRLKDNHQLLNLSAVIVRKEFLTNLNSHLYGCRFNEKNAHLGKYIAKKQGEQLRKKTKLSSPAYARKFKKQYNDEDIEL